MVTAYDFGTAAAARAAGIDMVLVGDSLGMVVVGGTAKLARVCDGRSLRIVAAFVSVEGLGHDGMRGGGAEQERGGKDEDGRGAHGYDEGEVPLQVGATYGVQPWLEALKPNRRTRWPGAGSAGAAKFARRE